MRTLHACGINAQGIMSAGPTALGARMCLGTFFILKKWIAASCFLNIRAVPKAY